MSLLFRKGLTVALTSVTFLALASCGAESPSVSSISPGTSDTVATNSFNLDPNAAPITLYYDGQTDVIEIEDVAILLVAFQDPTLTPAEIVTIVTTQFGIPIVEADVNGLAPFDPADADISDFNNDGVVTVEDVAILLAIVVTGSQDPNVFLPVADSIVPTTSDTFDANAFNALLNGPGNFFIDPVAGNDANDGRTAATAFATLQGVLEGTAGILGQQPIDFANQGFDVVVTVLGEVDETITGFIGTPEIENPEGSIRIVGFGDAAAVGDQMQTAPVTPTRISLDEGGFFNNVGLLLNTNYILDNVIINVDDDNTDGGTLISLLDNSQIINSRIGGDNLFAVSGPGAGGSQLLFLQDNARLTNTEVRCLFGDNVPAPINNPRAFCVFTSGNSAEFPRLTGNEFFTTNGNGTLLATQGRTDVISNFFEGGDANASVLVAANVRVDRTLGSTAPIDEGFFVGSPSGGPTNLDANIFNVGSGASSIGVFVGGFEPFLPSLTADLSARVRLGGIAGGVRNTFNASSPGVGIGIRNADAAQNNQASVQGANNFFGFDLDLATGGSGQATEPGLNTEPYITPNIVP